MIAARLKGGNDDTESCCGCMRPFGMLPELWSYNFENNKGVRKCYCKECVGSHVLYLIVHKHETWNLHVEENLLSPSPRALYLSDILWKTNLDDPIHYRGSWGLNIRALSTIRKAIQSDSIMPKFYDCYIKFSRSNQVGPERVALLWDVNRAAMKQYGYSFDELRERYFLRRQKFRDHFGELCQGIQTYMRKNIKETFVRDGSMDSFLQDFLEVEFGKFTSKWEEKDQEAAPAPGIVKDLSYYFIEPLPPPGKSLTDASSASSIYEVINLPELDRNVRPWIRISSKTIIEQFFHSHSLGKNTNGSDIRLNVIRNFIFHFASTRRKFFMRHSEGVAGLCTGNYCKNARYYTPYYYAIHLHTKHTQIYFNAEKYLWRNKPSEETKKGPMTKNIEVRQPELGASIDDSAPEWDNKTPEYGPLCNWDSEEARIVTTSWCLYWL